MFDWIKRLRQKLTRRVRQTAPEVTKNPNHALLDAQKKIIVDRAKKYNDKVEKLGVQYTNRLNEYLSTYFNSFSSDMAENKFAYDTLNKSWREYAMKANMSQKVLKLKVDSFEKEVAIIVSKNPQFQTEKL